MRVGHAPSNIFDNEKNFLEQISGTVTSGLFYYSNVTGVETDTLEPMWVGQNRAFFCTNWTVLKSEVVEEKIDGWLAELEPVSDHFYSEIHCISYST